MTHRLHSRTHRLRALAGFSICTLLALSLGVPTTGAAAMDAPHALPEELRPLVEALHAEVRQSFGENSSGDSPWNSSLAEYDVFMQYGAYTMALGALARAAGAYDYAVFAESLDATPESRKTSLVVGEFASLRLRTTLYANATGQLVDKGVGEELAWLSFEYRLLAGVYAAQSEWFAVHNAMITGSTGHYSAAHSLGPTAFRNAAAARLNFRFVSDLVGLADDKEDGIVLARSQLLEAAQARLARLEDPAHEPVGERLLAHTEAIVAEALASDRPILALAAYLGYVEQEANFEAQWDQHRGIAETSEDPVTRGRDRLDDYGALHPGPLEAVVVVDRLDQAAYLAGAGPETPEAAAGSTVVPFVEAALTLFADLAYPHATAEGSGLDTFDAAAATVWALVAGVALVPILRSRRTQGSEAS